MADRIAPRSRLLRCGTILTSDAAVPDLLRGDLLINDGRIDAVGEDLAVGPNVEIVDRTGTIIFPGLVDAHEHVWEGPFLLEKPDMGDRRVLRRVRRQAVCGGDSRLVV
jgi:cytosine/adenosine deaminase-related metal-dependent hydrolase